MVRDVMCCTITGAKQLRDAIVEIYQYVSSSAKVPYSLSWQKVGTPRDDVDMLTAVRYSIRVGKH